MEKIRVTKKDYFGVLRGLVEGAELENKDAVLEFIDHEVELLGKKRKTQTATQKANEGLKENIVNFLTENKGNKYTVTDLIAQVPEFQELEVTLTNQKVSALCKQLVDGGDIKKITEKKKSLFYVD